MDELTSYVLKGAEVSGTNLMPNSVSPIRSTKNTSPTQTIPKTGAELRSVNSVVDTTGKEAPTVYYAKTAQRYALPAFQRYPLDNYAQVKEANAYFAEHFDEFELPLRRQYAVNTLKRSEELGIKVASEVAQYGSDQPANPADVAIALDGRRSIIDECYHPVLEGIKVAAATMAPGDLAIALSELDQQLHIDHLYGREIIDPIASAFGVKTAAELEQSPQGSIVEGNDYMTVGSLKDYVLQRRSTLVDLYGAEKATAFQKDPVGTFNGLPSKQRRMIMRMVNDNGPFGASSS